jgi:DNA processing protein
MKKQPHTHPGVQAIQSNLFRTLENSVSDKYFKLDDKGRDSLLLGLLSITALKGAGFKTAQTLFDNGILHNLIDYEPNELIIRWEKNREKISHDFAISFLENKSQLIGSGEKSVKTLEKENIHFIPAGHPDYPESFFRLPAPPRWIFVKGNKDILKSSSIIAVVGTRSATIDGQRLAYLCASLLAKHNIIVLSGLAKGIDEKAHRGAVDYYGPTIAVLGCGIKIINTQENDGLISQIIDTDGAVISEYLPFDQASRSSFLRRNELQAALSKVVIPVECPSLESGTGATIRRALNINTPVAGVITSSNLINDNNLISTLNNLRKINIPVFSLKDGGNKTFWSFLKNALPEHTWNAKPINRQTIFFRAIERQVYYANMKLGLSLDAKDIELLAEKLKKVI